MPALDSINYLYVAMAAGWLLSAGLGVFFYRERKRTKAVKERYQHHEKKDIDLREHCIEELHAHLIEHKLDVVIRLDDEVVRRIRIKPSLNALSEAVKNVGDW